ncbi:MAG: class I SAM-dependent methyltransferase [Myxococcota bacterium]
MTVASEGLRRHYDAKYALEADGGSVECIVRPAIPTDRFEACCRFFPPLFHGGRILELAAGSGLVARSLVASGLPFESYTASDFSEARLAGLERTLDDPRVRVARMDVEDVPESEFGRYDAVILIALIEHLVDPLRAMQQVRKLLRPGGFAYIDTPNVAKYTRRLKLLFGRFPSTASRNEGLITYDGDPVDLHDEGHLHYFTRRSLRLMLTQRCGFSRVRALPYFTGGRLLGRAGDHALARLWPGMFSEVCLAAYV